MPEASAASINHKFNRIKTLPPLPKTATQLLEVLGDPEVEIGAIAAIIERDPALAARILGLANSAFFGQAQAITQVQQAIIRVLGVNLVKSLALSISLAGAFDTKECQAFDVADYWYTALGSAALTRMIIDRAPGLDNVASDRAYLVGLLHNLGVLLLASISPQEMSEVFEQHGEDSSIDLLDLERDRVGIDHLTAGEWLLERWHLPQVVVEVVGQLASVEYRGRYRDEWLSVRAAVDLVSAEKAGKALQLLPVSDVARSLALDEPACSGITERYLAQVETLREVARALN